MALFSLFYFPSLRHIGLTIDNAWIGASAWEIMRQVPRLIPGPKLQFRCLGLVLPLGWSYKHGPWELYLAIPFVGLLGRTFAALQWRNAVLAWLALGTTFRLGCQLYRDRWAAFLATVLLAASPVFVLFSITGGQTGLTTVPLGLAGLCLLLLYADPRQHRYAYWGFGCLGLALGCKSQFIALVIGLLACCCLYHNQIAALLPAEPAARRRFALGCLGALLVFSLPFVAALSMNENDVLSTWISHMMFPAIHRSNADYWNNLSLRWRQLLDLWEMGPPESLATFIKDPIVYGVRGQWFLVLALLAAAAIHVRRFLKGRKTPSRWAVPWIVMIVFLLASPLSPSLLRTLHLFPLLPLLYLIACSAITLASKPWRARVLAAFLVFGACRVADTYLYFRKFRAETAQTGGNDSAASRAALDLCQWFSRRPGSQAIFLGTDDAAYLLEYSSGGTNDPELLETNPVLTSASYQKEWDRLLDGKKRYFVADATQDAPTRSPLFVLKREAARRGLRLARVDQIASPNGEPTYEIYGVSH